MKHSPAIAAPLKTAPRRALIGGCSALAAVLLTRRAKALIPAIPVYDPGRFVAMLEALDRASDVFDQLSAGAGLLESAAHRLPTSARSVEDVMLSVRSLTSDVNAIGYRIDTVTRQYKALFPDEAAVRNTEPREMAELTQGWERELHLSSLAAQRSQTTLSRVDSNTRAARDVLASSAGQSSAVAQLQALVQMIEIINRDLVELSTTLNATERVNSSLAATEVSSREVIAERERRLLEAYDSRLAPEGIDDQFLRVP